MMGMGMDGQGWGGACAESIVYVRTLHPTPYAVVRVVLVWWQCPPQAPQQLMHVRCWRWHGTAAAVVVHAASSVWCMGDMLLG